MRTLHHSIRTIVVYQHSPTKVVITHLVIHKPPRPEESRLDHSVKSDRVCSKPTQDQWLAIGFALVVPTCV